MNYRHSKSEDVRDAFEYNEDEEEFSRIHRLRKSSYTWRNPIICFKIHPTRKGKTKKPPKPIKRSRYAQELFEIGAGWKDE